MILPLSETFRLPSLPPSIKCLLGIWSSESIASIVINLVYLYLPIWFIVQYSESLEWIAIGVGIAILCLLLPLVWELANKYWALSVHKRSYLCFLVAWLVRLALPWLTITSWIVLILVHCGFWLAMHQCYILKQAPRDQWWFIFWATESVIAVG